MKVDEFSYELPPERIAQYPRKRGESKLFVLHRNGKFEHRQFKEIVEYLNPEDCLVLNETRVIPARLHGKRRTGGKVEIFLLRPLGGNRWEVLAGPGRKAPPGEVISFQDKLFCRIIEKDPTFGTRIAEFWGEKPVDELIEELGEVPLPPYIRRKPEPIDRERYQTIYARIKGAVAAPTAGLHFTEEILKEIEKKGCGIVKIVLHSGLGTFRPIKAREIENHRMEPEYFRVAPEAAEELNRRRREGGRIFAAGTTVVRTLETVVDENGVFHAKEGETNLYIYPPYHFRGVDAILTNFHLPRSTLLLLVCAFAGKDLILRAYKEAIEKGYMFYSYGDAMLIL